MTAESSSRHRLPERPGGRMWMPRPGWAAIGRWSVARRLLVLQAVVVGLLVIVGTVLAGLDARRAAHDRAEGTVTAVAESIADSPNLRAALTLPDPTAVLQPYTELIRHDTGIDFITIMQPDGIRYLVLVAALPFRAGGKSTFLWHGTSPASLNGRPLGNQVSSGFQVGQRSVDAW